MKSIALFISLFILPSFIWSQANFVSNGTIIYEKRTQQHKQLLELGEENEWIQMQLKNVSKVLIETYELQFTPQQSLYKLSKENPDNKYSWGRKPSETDWVQMFFDNKQLKAQKEVFEQVYQMEDSIRNLTWRLSDETRTIAGFECKKAVTKICDSVYVVAFYTDQIIPSGGPESFGGLPGMILGLAVPRLHTTWFATAVTVNNKELALPTGKQKGKKASWKILEADLQKATKDWGKESARLIWGFLI
ncbi:MAG: GLPGLI family protein [Chitinophagaceae bacterium]